ncbi:MAG: tRNA preQ1(34) S-adenosylmethionine ribosyltransferase-isomerase QueA [Desulfovibrio sp.]|jgi:S-adenosylmethionine:tRNA ribosyltransferase-isomerase|nr:tRNA preQ1(34) S-adenosylmethionine ribosyltransferase-isomerase QueA [Desulfovibrio sp.]
MQAMPSDLSLADYDYELPEDRIAQHPADDRGGSRLLVMSRHGDVEPRIAAFADLQDHLPEGALLVANNAKVLHARLLGKRATGGKVEFLLLTPLPLLLREAVKEGGRSAAVGEGLVRSGGRIREGETLRFGDLGVTVLACGDFGHRTVRLAWKGDLRDVFAACGHVPLPPYIKRDDRPGDAERYQTVYAQDDKTGAVAAPTAGLHFTEEHRARLAAMGFAWVEITLYIGYGTFSLVRCQDIRQHRMHAEYVEISETAARAVNEAKAQGRPVLAVGTTTTRALEGVVARCGKMQGWEGWTDVFLHPGCRFHVIDALLTNFHLPQSSLLMLVSAFAGRERILAAYAKAIDAGFRVFSYGDAMLIR